MTPVAMASSRALIHFVWQGSIVGLLLRTVLFALRKRSANSRYVAGCAALTVLAVMRVAHHKLFTAIRVIHGYKSWVCCIAQS